MESRGFIGGLIVGVLATVTMDVVAVIILRLGIAGRGPRRTGPDLIGRWIGYLLRGKFRHTDVLQTPPLPGELVLGLAAHYSIGIVLNPCVPWCIGCGARAADSPQRHPLRNGHHGLALVSHVPITGDELAGTGCAGGSSSGSGKPVQSHHLRPGYSPVDGSAEANLKFSCCPTLAIGILSLLTAVAKAFTT